MERQRAALLAAFSKNQILFLSQNFKSVKHGSISIFSPLSFPIFTFVISLLDLEWSDFETSLFSHLRPGRTKYRTILWVGYQQAYTLLTKVTMSFSAKNSYQAHNLWLSPGTQRALGVNCHRARRAGFSSCEACYETNDISSFTSFNQCLKHKAPSSKIN